MTARLIALLMLVLPLISEAAQPPAQRVVRFAVFAARPVTDVAFIPRPGAEAQTLQFEPTLRSRRHEYRGPQPLRFVDPRTGENVAEAMIPDEIGEALLIFFPARAGEAGGLRYRIAVLDDSAARHGAGGLSIVNLSGLTLEGTVNKQPVTLRAGLNPTIPVGRTAEIELRTTLNGRVRRAYSATSALASGERALLILLPPYSPGSVEVQSRLLVDQLSQPGRR